MLKNLFIRNIVLIEKMKLDFSKGLTVFSGETGAGKSIVLTSLGLAIGSRADFSLIRNGSKEGSVIAEFNIDKKHLAYKKISENGLEDQESIILRRVLSKEGVSKAFINDSPVTATFLQEIGSLLVEIHGQNEKIGLLDSSNHIKILDKYGVDDEVLLKVEKTYDNYKKLSNIYNELFDIENNKTNQIKEIKNNIQLLENINLTEEEYHQLLKRRNLMSQYEKIFLAINDLNNIFSDEKINFFNRIAKNISILEKTSDQKLMLKEVKQIIESLNFISTEGKELTSNITGLKDNFNFDQKELDEIEQRLFDISNLSRRFQVQPENLNEKLKFFKDDLESYNSNIENIQNIKKKLEIAKNIYEEECKNLSNLRKQAALTLESLVNQELKPLKLDNANFSVQLLVKDIDKWNLNGMDYIKFLVKLNKGTKEGEIHKISSGGELSRLMLAINLVIAKSDNKKTLIFDEVDSGVSGAVSESIGMRLRNLSNYQQILVVTHLPQVAARGNKHFRASKYVMNEITFTKVLELNDNERVEEIAQMISGDKVTEEARVLSNKLLTT